MARRLVGGAAAGLVLAVVVAAVPFADHLRMLHGNLRFARGELARAIVSYRQAAAGTARPYAVYNLASTYAALGESQAAERLLAELAERADDPGLLFRTRFAAANLAYARGEYVEAVQGFRGALALRSADRAAKHNLEVALRRLASRQADTAASAPATAASPLSGGAEQLLRFAVQQEDTTWGSRGSEAAGADSW